MAAMSTRSLQALKGADLRAVQAFRERARAALGKAVVSIAFLERRPLGLPPAEPIGQPPGELRVIVRLERRDVFAEERIDAIALEVALATGSLVAPLIVAAEDLASPAARASRLAADVARAEELT